MCARCAAIRAVALTAAVGAVRFGEPQPDHPGACCGRYAVWLYCDSLLRLCTVHAAKPSAEPPAVSVQRCRHQPGNAAPRQARGHAMQVSGIDIRNLFLWNSVMLRLDDGMHVEYVHIKAGSACVQPGQRVRAGEAIPRRFFVACVDHPLGQSNVLYLVVVTAFGGMG